MRSTFFSSVAHELRTPLNSIIPILKMILDQLIAPNHGLNPRILSLIKVVLNSSLHLQNVIEDALDISRLENNKFQLFKDFFDIRSALNEVCEIMKFQFDQKSIDLQLFIAPNVPKRIFSDQKRLKQVLFNLLGNAVKFTYTGYVSVELSFDNLQETMTCIVKDTGIGISEEGLSKLFKFFGCLTKTKDCNRGGMGLGLTISKMIIQELGGDISVSSEQGKGSTFTFIIPLDEYEIFPH